MTDLEWVLDRFWHPIYHAMEVNMISMFAPTLLTSPMSALMNETLPSHANLDPVSSFEHLCIVYNTFPLSILSPVEMNITVDRRTEVVQGNNVTLWCNAESMSVANLTSYVWRNSLGVVTPDGSRVNITVHNASYSNYYGDFIFNSSLTFSPLLPSDGDRYECELTIGLPEVGVNISNTTTADLRVRGLLTSISLYV